MRIIASSALSLLICACTNGSMPVDQATQATDSAASASLAERVISASSYSISQSEELNEFVRTTAEAAIDENCASCHGSDLTGAPGVPNLIDFDWLWGITFEETNEVGPVMEIEQTILYGVRNEDCPDIIDISYYGACADTRFSQMPGYLETGAFDEQEITELTEYVVSLTGAEADSDLAERGAANWSVCTECHGPEGYGHKPYGGPDLSDGVSLFGADRETIFDVIANGRTEVCPAWKDTLDAATIKSLAVYIWQKVQGG